MVSSNLMTIEDLADYLKVTRRTIYDWLKHNKIPALKLVGQTSMRTVTDYTFGVIPMFILMGAFVSNSGVSRELFRAANTLVGHLKGGLGIATVVACGGFAAICGSSVATAATFSAVAYPEMRRHGYPQSFATGVIAAPTAASKPKLTG